MRKAQTLLFFAGLIFSVPLFSQTTIRTEPYLYWNGDINENLSYEVYGGLRLNFFNHGDFKLDGEFLIAGGSLDYQTGKSTWSAGYLRRFYTVFHSSEHDEDRFFQQYEYEQKDRSWNFSGAVKLEQRFRKSTRFRSRYKAEISHKISKKTKLSFSAETLWEISEARSPVFDERLTASLSRPLIRNLNATLSFEYRKEDFTQDSENIFLGIIGLKYNLN